MARITPIALRARAEARRLLAYGLADQIWPFAPNSTYLRTISFYLDSAGAAGIGIIRTRAKQLESYANGNVRRASDISLGASSGTGTAEHTAVLEYFPGNAVF